MKFFALATAILSAVPALARPDVQPVSELANRGVGLDPRTFGLLWGGSKCLMLKSVECCLQGKKLDRSSCRCVNNGWVPNNDWEQPTKCNDHSIIATCWSKGHTCDSRCICVKPPTTCNKCTNWAAICRCAGKGQGVNPDCSCKQKCTCWDQWECHKVGGTLDDQCKCIKPSGGGNGGWGSHWGKGKRDLCTVDEIACPTAPGSNMFECLNPKTSLESCGGCQTEGGGRDCTAIEGAVDVSCQEGQCVVAQCEAGYTLEGNDCVKA